MRRCRLTFLLLADVALFKEKGRRALGDEEDRQPDDGGDYDCRVFYPAPPTSIVCDEVAADYRT